MTPLRTVISDVYKFGGNLSEEQLALPVVLLNIQTAYKKRVVDLQLSDLNHLLESFDLTPVSSERVYEITEPNVGEVVLIQYSIDGVSFFGNVDSVNKSNLYLSQRDGILAVAFYGNPKLAEFSLTPPTAIQQFRFFYEPHEIPVPRLSSSVDLNNNAFLTLVALDAMLTSLEDATGVDEGWRNRKRDSLIMQIGEWERRWNKWIIKPSVEGVVQKRSYNQRRRRMN